MRLNKLLQTAVCLIGFSIAVAGQTTAPTLQEGISFYLSGNYQNAIETLQKVVAVNANDRNVWLFLGMAYARQDKDKEAEKAFKKALEIPYDIKDDFSGENDSPVKLTKKPRANYTEDARRNLTSGKVKLAVEYGADGKIKFIFAVRKLTDGLTEQAWEAARKIEFEPAKRTGKAISVVDFSEYNFNIYRGNP